MWIILKNDWAFYMVGFYSPAGEFIQLMTCNNLRDAAQYVAYLNGGGDGRGLGW